MIELDEDAKNVATAVVANLRDARRQDQPFRHHLVDGLLPASTLAALNAIDISAPAFPRGSGKRELYNDRRLYAGSHGAAQWPVLAAVAAAFQGRRVATAVALRCDAPLEGCFLRVEYAVDADGFWLEPHTDLGVKKFTGLIYLSASQEPAEDLGTDLYADADRYWGRVPFAANRATLFVPGVDTWHGFVPRSFRGLRRSLIVNYVDANWRDRDQLAFPNEPIRLDQA